MKAKLILLVVVVTLLSSCATVQYSDPIKVAITEVTDASGEVADGTKEFICTALTDAIKKIKGYEVYTTPIILGNTIPQNIDYILTTQVNLLSETFALLSTKIVEPTTGKIVSSSSVSTRADINSLRTACKELTNKLIGVFTKKIK